MPCGRVSTKHTYMCVGVRVCASVRVRMCDDCVCVCVCVFARERGSGQRCDASRPVQVPTPKDWIARSQSRGTENEHWTESVHGQTTERALKLSGGVDFPRACRPPRLALHKNSMNSELAATQPDVECQSHSANRITTSKRVPVP